MCVCVKREVTRGGQGSGQHQLSECEVQPQAKASFACGDKPDPSHPLTHTHTHEHTTRSSPTSLLPSPFKEFALKQHILQTVLGLPLAVGETSAPPPVRTESNVMTRRPVLELRSSYRNNRDMDVSPANVCNNWSV